MIDAHQTGDVTALGVVQISDGQITGGILSFGRWRTPGGDAQSLIERSNDPVHSRIISDHLALFFPGFESNVTILQPNGADKTIENHS
jgi:hypothetical protein